MRQILQLATEETVKSASWAHFSLTRDLILFYYSNANEYCRIDNIMAWYCIMHIIMTYYVDTTNNPHQSNIATPTIFIDKYRYTLKIVIINSQ